jgi:hypothetical protein
MADLLYFLFLAIAAWGDMPDDYQLVTPAAGEYLFSSHIAVAFNKR